MTRRQLVRTVLTWAALTLLGAFAVVATFRISPAPAPNDSLSTWALDRLDAARAGTEPAAAPSAYEAEGPVVVIAWSRGGILARHVGSPDLVAAVNDAAAIFARRLRGEQAWGEQADSPVQFTVEVPVGEARLLPAFPYLHELSLVPRHEGLLARFGDEVALVTPEELLSYGAYDSGIPTPVPDLGLGAPVAALAGRLARDLRREPEEVEVRRFRSLTLSRAVYPNPEPENVPTEERLREASVEGASFLLRHQQRDGTWTYVYDGSTGRPRQGGYNIPRHSGTTYFIAQVDRYVGMPEAREGALTALRWLQRHRLTQCGDDPCVVDGGRVDVGSAALTVVAATEVLAKEDDPLTRNLAVGLTSFLRSQQREDGELMHEYDVRAQAPIDVQHMYYSGEAAFALLKAHEVLGDERDLRAAEKLMAHLTGAGWDFLGSRYYYGEEHWTCIAAGEARGRIEIPDALDFCRRWYEWNDQLQYRAGDTPWPVEGAFGVGPVVVPRLTPVGSRSEAFVGTYLLMDHAGMDTAGVRGVVERGLGQLLRWRWAPGPSHHFADPDAARGGMPGSPVDLTSRNDFVQHAGSAWIRWAEVLRQEREGGGE